MDEDDPRTPEGLGIKRSFPAVADREARLLILGSLPGERSLGLTQYYGHPRNQFWRLLGNVIETQLEPLRYPERLQALLKARVALWDTVASAVRPGSLDSAIKDHRANDLATLLPELPNLRAVAYNGGTAARIGERQLAEEEGITRIRLPSSSPAYTLSFERKLQAWQELRKFL
jgi:hypoxanthine-DNA glycosylase